MYNMVSWVFYTARLDNTAKKEAEKGALLGKELPEMRKKQEPRSWLLRRMLCCDGGRHHLQLQSAAAYST
jgi:hypothetical protein